MLFLDYARAASESLTGLSSKSTQKIERLNGRVEDLERRTDRIVLVCQALWELLREKTDIPEEKVFEKMQEIDLRDGQEDGRVTPRVHQCRGCKRPVMSKRRSCVYCGEPLENPHVAE